MPSVGTTGAELVAPNRKRVAFHLENTHATQTLYMNFVDGPGNISSTSPANITVKAGNNADVNSQNQGVSVTLGWAIIGSGAGTTYNLTEFINP